jgi:hypothetical protein
MLGETLVGRGIAFTDQAAHCPRLSPPIRKTASRTGSKVKITILVS